MRKYKVGDLVLFPDPHSHVKHLSIVLEVYPDSTLRLHTFGTSQYSVHPHVVSDIDELDVPEPSHGKAKKTE